MCNTLAADPSLTLRMIENTLRMTKKVLRMAADGKTDRKKYAKKALVIRRHWLPNPTTNRTQSNLFELLRCEGGKDSKNLKGRGPTCGEDRRIASAFFYVLELAAELSAKNFVLGICV